MSGLGILGFGRKAVCGQIAVKRNSISYDGDRI